MIQKLTTHIKWEGRVESNLTVSQSASRRRVERTDDKTYHDGRSRGSKESQDWELLTVEKKN